MARPFMQSQGYKDSAVYGKRSRQPVVLDDATIRDFGGGWNVVDSELNLDSRYQSQIDNIAREEDGSLGVRYGTRLHATLPGAHDIVDMYYFLDQIVVVNANGNIYGVYGDGTFYAIKTWTADDSGNEEWAGTPMDFVSFAVYQKQLIIANGQNAPLSIEVNESDKDTIPPKLSMTYLHNKANVTNGNIPIAKYVAARDRFLIFANSDVYRGDFGSNWIHISALGSPGLYAYDYLEGGDTVVDAAASTAVDIDISEWGIEGDPEITGLAIYRDRLVVGLPNSVVIATLGQLVVDTYGNDTHDPDFSDILDNVGVHSHRSMVNLGTDMLFVDHIGVVSLEKSRFSGDVEPKRVSELVDPVINANVNRLTQNTMETGCFAVYNSREKQYMLFMPNHEVAPPGPNSGQYDPAFPWITLADPPMQADPDDPDVVHINWPNHNLQVGEWFWIDNLESWNTVDASVYNNTLQQVTRIVSDDMISIATAVPIDPLHPEQIGGGPNTEVKQEFTETPGYIYTRIPELKVKAWSRYRAWQWDAACASELANVFFAQGTKIYVYGNPANPIYQDFEGDNPVPIPWTVEYPWFDIDERMKLKESRYIALDTTGDSEFDVMMFVDSLYKQMGELIPNNIMLFKGGDSAGYGDGQQHYGGTIHTADERLTAWTARFKLAKIRLQGQSTRPLRIISISLAYKRGSYRR